LFNPGKPAARLTPDSFSSGEQSFFEIDGVSYTQNAVSHSGGEFDCFPAGDGGGFELAPTNGSNINEWGRRTRLSSFPEHNTLFVGSLSGPAGMPVITPNAPEPSGLLLGSGALTLLGLVRKRFFA
jgi:hypothetical protein